MLLAPVATSAPRGVTPTPLHNLHVITTGRPNDEGRFNVTTDTVTFGEIAKGDHGGNRITSQYVNGSLAGMHIRAYPTNAAERAAAQALDDAITGSGLLTQLTPSPNIGAPAIGFTRIFLDRRSKFIEFETDKAPAAAQAVLAALEVYRAIGMRG
ncbi:MAG: hypothetical protein JWM90_452 [Thermoleophilia bacterium]|nr:hypothetical protein [Thermoleophilia bacterium]